MNNFTNVTANRSVVDSADSDGLMQSYRVSASRKPHSLTLRAYFERGLKDPIIPLCDLFCCIAILSLLLYDKADMTRNEQVGIKRKGKTISLRALLKNS